jgi:hypothetical protein
MAGNGPPPAEQRRRRNADTYADVQTQIPRESAELRGPTFREACRDLLADFEPQALLPAVERWWNTWRRSPLAATFLETDWQRLTMLAVLVASYYARPHYTKLAEIRQSESLLGATHVDRLKARIKVAAPAAQQAPAGVAVMDDYRDRFAG